MSNIGLLSAFGPARLQTKPAALPPAFDSEAKAEFDDAASYYDQQRPGLGDAFAAEVEQATRRIVSPIEWLGWDSEWRGK